MPTIADISTEDLQALRSGDMSKVSTEGLKTWRAVQAGDTTPAKPAGPTRILEHPLDYVGGRIKEGAGRIAAAADPTKPAGTGLFSRMGEELGGAIEIASTPADILLQGGSELISKGLSKLPGTSPRGHVSVPFMPNIQTGVPTPEEVKGKLEEGLSLTPAGKVSRIEAAVPKGATTLSPQSGRRLRKALEADKTTAAEAEAKAKASIEPGAVLSDVAGQNVQALLKHTAKNPGESKTTTVDFLTQRQKGALDRIASDLQDVTGVERTASEAVEDTMRVRAENSVPMWKEVLEGPGDVLIWDQSPEFERLSAFPPIKEAMQKAVTGWQTTAGADGYGAMNPGALVERGGILRLLGGKVPVFPNLQFWHYTKKALDAMIEDKGFKADGSMNQYGRDLTKYLQRLRTTLDSVVPEYKAARDVWAGESAYMNSVRMGQDILRGFETEGGLKGLVRTADEDIALFNSLSESEKQGIREGAVTAIIAKMERDPAKLPDLMKYIRSPAVQKRILAMIPDEAAKARWENRFAFEEKSTETVRKGLTGSDTYSNIAEAIEAQQTLIDLFPDMINTIRGQPYGGIRRMIAAALEKINNRRLRSSDKELSDILTSPEAARNISSIARKPSRNRPMYVGQGQSAAGSVLDTATELEQLTRGSQ